MFWTIGSVFTSSINQFNVGYNGNAYISNMKSVSFDYRWKLKQHLQFEMKLLPLCFTQWALGFHLPSQASFVYQVPIPKNHSINVIAFSIGLDDCVRWITNFNQCPTESNVCFVFRLESIFTFITLHLLIYSFRWVRCDWIDIVHYMSVWHRSIDRRKGVKIPKPRFIYSSDK